ncbi:catalytic LigB subunit of aromatic ring-opening dioxygenase family protein [Peziza echinospora]|nr:catalytic LigB subunit of aromatic ring-opening dioxygenase family protein [Peziza echinospora]
MSSPPPPIATSQSQSHSGSADNNNNNKNTDSNVNIKPPAPGTSSIISLSLSSTTIFLVLVIAVLVPLVLGSSGALLRNLGIQGFRRATTTTATTTAAAVPIPIATSTSTSTSTSTNLPKMSSFKTPVYFISHGGPNVMYETDHPAYGALQRLGREITGPGVLAGLNEREKKGAAAGGGKGVGVGVGAKGVVVFSAHWQAGKRRVEVNVGEGDGLIYDFYGFPDHYYKEKYPHRGSKALAETVLGLLEKAGIEAEGVKRDIDHGVWAGFKCLFDPKDNPLNVPIVQVSLYDNEDPVMHYNLGKAIAGLREQGVVVICSGMAVHNLRDMRFVYGTNKTLPYAVSFDDALKQAVTAGTGEERKKALVELLKRGDARQAHPTFDHLLPVHVAAGAAEGEKATQIWTKAEMSFSWAQYRFGELLKAEEEVKVE